jgi:hypothetical protein
MAPWNLLIYIGELKSSYIFLDALVVGGEHIKRLETLLGSHLYYVLSSLETKRCAEMK